MKKIVVAVISIAIMIAICFTFVGSSSNSEVPTATKQVVVKETVKELGKMLNDQHEQLIKVLQDAKAEEEKREESKVTESESAEADENTGQMDEFSWDGEVITAYSGVANGPSGFETYYNLPMEGVVSIMRGLGYDEEQYPYWVREDGCKMLGDYIMVAANLEIRPYGTILPCSLGMAIVCDTGTFAASNPTQLDIAVTW